MRGVLLHLENLLISGHRTLLSHGEREAIWKRLERIMTRSENVDLEDQIKEPDIRNQRG